MLSLNLLCCSSRLRLLRDFLDSGVSDVTLQVATQQVKNMQMLGASIGPQLLHGHGLCNFWASILRVARLILEGKSETRLVISTIVKFRCSTLDVPQFPPGHSVPHPDLPQKFGC